MTNVLQTFFEHNLYCTVSSVSPAGLPWASPLYFGYDDEGCLYVRSAKDAQHMQYIKNQPEVFVTLFDSTQPIGTGSGLYLQGIAEQLEEEAAVRSALQHMNKRLGATTFVEKFVGNGPKRVIKIRPYAAWTNNGKMTEAGFIDWREEVELHEA